MDKNLEILFKDNEGRKFTKCNRNWMIQNGELCIQITNDEYLPIDTNGMSEVLLNKIWEELLNEKRAK